MSYYFSYITCFGGCEYRFLSRGRVSLERNVCPSPALQKQRNWTSCAVSRLSGSPSLLFLLCNRGPAEPPHPGRHRGVCQANAVQAAADRFAPHTWWAPWRQNFLYVQTNDFTAINSRWQTPCVCSWAAVGQARDVVDKIRGRMFTYRQLQLNSSHHRYLLPSSLPPAALLHCGCVSPKARTPQKQCTTPNAVLKQRMQDIDRTYFEAGCSRKD